MKMKLWHERARRLAALLFLITVPPAVTLVWLGASLLDQNRRLVAQQAIERRQAAAQTVINSLERALNDAEARIGAGPLLIGMVRLIVTSDGVSATPADRVLWLPATLPDTAANDPRFALAERREFGGRELEALAMYREIAASPDVRVAAAAWLDIARIHFQRQRWAEALDAYRRVATMPGATVAGAPADLQARRQICALLERLGKPAEAAREAASLAADLLSGRWQLDGPAWELTTADLSRWTSPRIAADPARATMSAAAEAVWTEERVHAGTPAREAIPIGSSFVTVLRQTSSRDVRLLLISQNVVERWLADATAGLAGRFAVSLARGDPKFLTSVPAAARARHLGAPATEDTRIGTAESGLPWALNVTAVPSSVSGPMVDWLIFAPSGLGAILLLIGGGAYMLWRVMRHELDVARLQTQFVAAVSHEFRTPLTSLRHATELLSESDDVPAARRRSFYAAMHQDTRRLQRLVESLLDVSRMQDRRKAYDFQPTDIAALVRQVVDEFRASAGERQLAITVNVPDGRSDRVRADSVALSNALWNLLDNAVKYSNAPADIQVSLHNNGAGVAIDVRDRGIGIAAAEQQAIFGRFVRGTRALELGISGTGLGLALVSHIVAAHAGEIRVQSEEGRGSTFTIWLSRDASAAV